MGWRDRDWAKLSDDELNAIYGGVRAPARQRRVSPVIAWSVAALVLFLVGAFALGHESESTPQAAQSPEYVYGHAIVFAGQPATCTEIAYNTVVRRWVCLIVSANENNVRFLEATPYDGSCAQLVADQTQGRWICESSTPLPPSKLPPGPSF